ncbi:MAG: VanZ family protein [Planctomycetes bacterium]|nr:VanZ family protein [Planctomycetota bacterium]
MSLPELRPPTTRPILTADQIRWLALACLLLVIYGSLVPLRFRAIPMGHAIAAFQEAMSAPVRFESRSDWVANILLFIPLSFSFMAYLSVDKPHAISWFAAVIVLPICALLSAAIEFTQLFFPPRVTSINDVAAESLGALIGITFWLVFGQSFIARFRRLWNDLGGEERRGVSLLTAYMVVLLLIHALPLDLTISPVEIYHKYRDGRVQLVPFAGGNENIWETIQKHLTNIAYFAPVGFLLTRLAQPHWRQPHSWPRVLGTGFGVAGLVELVQLFVVTRYFDVTDIITGGFAVFGGWAVALTYRQRQTSPNATVFVAWVLLLMFINWQPFDFDFTLDVMAQRPRRLALIPFADYYRNNYLSAFDQIFARIVLFIPLGALAMLAFPAQRQRGLPAVLAQAVAFTTMLEAGQLFLPSRYASVTDVIIESFGIWLGTVLGRHMGNATQSTG